MVDPDALRRARALRARSDAGDAGLGAPPRHSHGRSIEVHEHVQDAVEPHFVTGSRSEQRQMLGAEVRRARPALATALFRDGALSLARAASLAGMSLGEFVSHVSRLGIPVVALDAREARQDMDTLDEWLAAS